MTKRFEDRITVAPMSLSTTQHYLVVSFDGKPVITVDNTRSSMDERRPYLGDYRDHMLRDADEAAPDLKIWFLQRQMQFTNGPVREPNRFHHEFDLAAARARREDKAASDRAANEEDVDSELVFERMRG